MKSPSARPGTTTRRGVRCLVSILLLLVLAGVSTAAADSFPVRPITFVVPYAPGGAADLSTRVVGDKMGEILGQRIVADYRPGGGAAIGASFVARSKPDGYTVFVGGPSPMVLIPTLGYPLD